MAQKCAEVVSKFDIDKMDPGLLKRNLIQLGQLTSALQVSVETLKKQAPDDHEYQGTEADIRDAKKRINEMEDVLNEQEKGKIKPESIADMWNKRQALLEACYKRLESRFKDKVGEYK